MLVISVESHVVNEVRASLSTERATNFRVGEALPLQLLWSSTVILPYRLSSAVTCDALHEGQLHVTSSLAHILERLSHISVARYSTQWGPKAWY